MRHKLKVIVATIALLASFIVPTSAHAALLPVSRYHQAPTTTVVHRLPVSRYYQHVPMLPVRGYK